MKTKLSLLCLSLVLAVAGLAACDKASPVAPAGTVLSVTANPTQIGASGTSQIRVVALRANGTPVNPGTQIRMSTNLGTIDPLVEVGDGGVALGTLRGDGRIGTAEVTAAVGADTTASVEVAVGRAAANISLQANPAQVDEEGGVVELLAVVRDATGQPLADASVNFQSEVGSLASRGALRQTNSSGVVTDRLVVSESDLQAISNRDSFRAAVVVGTSSGTTSDNVEIRVNRCAPRAIFTASEGSNQTVTIINDSRGQQTLSYFWSFGGVLDPPADDEMLTSRDPGTIRYAEPGQKQLSLRVSNVCGSSFAAVTVNPQP